MRQGASQVVVHGCVGCQGWAHLLHRDHISAVVGAAVGGGGQSGGQPVQRDLLHGVVKIPVSCTVKSLRMQRAL